MMLLYKDFDENIKQHDDKINELLTSPETWVELDQAVSEAMKTDEEQQEQQEAPKSEKKKKRMKIHLKKLLRRKKKENKKKHRLKHNKKQIDKLEL